MKTNLAAFISQGQESQCQLRPALLVAGAG